MTRNLSTKMMKGDLIKVSVYNTCMPAYTPKLSVMIYYVHDCSFGVYRYNKASLL